LQVFGPSFVQVSKEKDRPYPPLYSFFYPRRYYQILHNLTVALSLLENEARMRLEHSIWFSLIQDPLPEWLLANM
jgi:hypothetical protein